jgi:hypothetical protein
VQRAGSASWRIGIGGDQAVHAALYIRDACRLTPTGPDVPPPLAGDVAAADPFLTDADVAVASVGWLDWWLRLVHVEGAAELGEFTVDGFSDDGRARELAAYQAVFDPPEFESLAPCPPLRDVARRISGPALLWWRGNRHDMNEVGHADRMVTWSSRRSVAEAVIEEYQVSPGRVRAGVIVLRVVGKWSRIPEPGVLLCSFETLGDESLFLGELKKTFETGLRRGTPPTT